MILRIGNGMKGGQTWRVSMTGRVGVYALCILAILAVTVTASKGDQLKEFRECVQICKERNCEGDNPSIVPLHLRLFLWSCPSECDYTCQQIITTQRVLQAKTDPSLISDPVVQYHGKWPFIRLFGIQEPFSVLFSLMNLLAHQRGMREVRAQIPASYPLRPYYLLFGYFGVASWIFSMLFHTRDFVLTERLDYFAAGASVMYGLYLAPIRIFRLDLASTSSYKDHYASPSRYGPANQPMSSVLRLWTTICLLMYLAHVSFLTFIRWDYTYNMAANVCIGALQNVLWSWFSIRSFQRVRRLWAAMPGLCVTWITLAMSLELLDFPPIGGWVDAHSLWHLGTVLPTVWWYNFLIKDARQDMQDTRLKA